MGNNITILRAGSFQDLLELMGINLYRNAITSIETNAFSNLPQLKMLDLGSNLISTLHAGTFQGLLKLEIINLYYNYITILQTGVFQDLPNLMKIDLKGNRIVYIEADPFSNLPQLTDLDFGLYIAGGGDPEVFTMGCLGYMDWCTIGHWEIPLGDAEMFALSHSEGAIQLCEDETLPPAHTLCIQNLVIPGKDAYLYATAAFAFLILLVALVMLHRNKVLVCDDIDICACACDTLGDWKVVCFFAFRIFDVLSSWGVFAIVAQQSNWYDVMDPMPDEDDVLGWRLEAQRADRVKYMVLISSIFATLFFVAEILVVAQKLNLAQKLGGCFNGWYKPKRKAVVWIMCLTLLLDSIPRLYCGVEIWLAYGNQGSAKAVRISIVSSGSAFLSILFKFADLFKLLCGHTKCCSWCPECCGCDVSGNFDNDLKLEQARGVAAPTANARRPDGEVAATYNNPAFNNATYAEIVDVAPSSLQVDLYDRGEVPGLDDADTDSDEFDC